MFMIVPVDLKWAQGEVLVRISASLVCVNAKKVTYEKREKYISDIRSIR